jgi:D-alanine-D-alanine ligase
MTKTNICVLFGGRSSEYEVSLSSAYAVLSHMSREKYNIVRIGITKAEGAWYLFDGTDDAVLDGSWCSDLSALKRVYVDTALGGGLFTVENEECSPVPCDAVFPVLHGACGEDGTVQGLLDLCGIKYVGCGVSASSAAMDKAMTKSVVSSLGIPQARCVVLRRRDWEKGEDCAAAAEAVGYPMFVKPSRAGSSVGVSKAKNRSELDGALEKAFREDDKVLCEEAIVGAEVEVAVLEEKGKYTVSFPGEIVPGTDFYDYETKYVSNVASYHIPARVSDEDTELLRDYARRIFQALDCRSLSRVDFFATKNGPVFNEINTLPGFTPISMYPKLMAHSGIDFSLLIDRLIESVM